jgi:hypothetical protein
MTGCEFKGPEPVADQKRVKGPLNNHLSIHWFVVNLLYLSLFARSH